MQKRSTSRHPVASPQLKSPPRRFPLLVLALTFVAILAIGSTLWTLWQLRSGEGAGKRNPTGTQPTAIAASSVTNAHAALGKVITPPLEAPPPPMAGSKGVAQDLVVELTANDHSEVLDVLHQPQPPPSQVTLSLVRIGEADLKALIARQHLGTLQVVIQSAVTGAILHPVGFSTPKCLTDGSFNEQPPTIPKGTNSLILPTTPCQNSKSFMFSTSATKAVMSTPEYFASVYNLSLAIRKFKKQGDDGQPVHNEDGDGQDDPTIPKDIRARAANYGTFLSREVHHGTVTVDKMWARSMESWTVTAIKASAGIEADAVKATLFEYEFRGIQHELQPWGDRMCIGFEEAPPTPHGIDPAAGDNHEAEVTQPIPTFVPPRFIEAKEGFTHKKKGKRGGGTSECDKFILWRVADGEVERLAKASNSNNVGQPTAVPPTAVHLVAGLSIRNMALFNSEKQRYNDKVVFDNWLRLLSEGVKQYPIVQTQLALCLDVPEDLEPILKAAKRYGFDRDSGAIVVLSREDTEGTHASLRGYFDSNSLSFKSDGATKSIVPLLVISAHCEKHPSYKNQPTYRGAFAFSEYVLRATQLFMQQRQSHLEYPLHPSVPIAVGTSFVAFANSDIILDHTDVFNTLEAVAKEMVSQVAESPVDGAPGYPRPVLISGRRWNCGTHNIVKAIKEGSGGPGEASHMDNSYLRRHCSLFGDNAQDYFIVSAGALHWGMPPGVDYSHAYEGAKGALRDAVERSHKDITIFVQDLQDAAAAGAQVSHKDWFPDAFVAAGAYHRDTRRQRWSSHRNIVPPFVVGGIAFDNWFVSTMMDKRRQLSQVGTGEPTAWVIDASSSLYSFHINHDDNRFASHHATKSDYNLEMAHYCHGWPEGKVGVSPIVSLRLPFDSSRSSVLPGVDAVRTVIHRRSIMYCPIGLPAQLCQVAPASVEGRKNAFDGLFEPRH